MDAAYSSSSSSAYYYYYGTTEIEIVTELLCRYGSLYAPQLVVLAMLSAITVYRREMSCNRCYSSQEEEEEESREEEEDGDDDHDDDDNNNNAREGITGIINTRCNWDDVEITAEELLEGVDLYCSGAALMPVWGSILEHAERARYGLAAVTPSLLLKYVEEEMNALAKVQQQQQQQQQQTRQCNGGNGGKVVKSLRCHGAEQHQDHHHHHQQQQQQQQQQEGHRVSSSLMSFLETDHKNCNKNDLELPHFLSDEFPADAQVHILSFLHPRDVVEFGCVNRKSHAVVNNPDTETTEAVWKTLWYRDYGWIVTMWDIGVQALKHRSNIDNLDVYNNNNNNTSSSSSSSHNHYYYSKEFYFNFGMSYLNYVLAGHATIDKCLVGIGGHIYDLSNFILSHPGSPETVLVQAGRDATHFFNGVRHSTGAKKTAQSLCVVVDTSKLLGHRQHNHNNEDRDNNNNIQDNRGSYGLRPTTQTQTSADATSSTTTATTTNSSAAVLPDVVDSPPITLSPELNPTSRNNNTLRRVKENFQRREEDAIEMVSQRVRSGHYTDVLGDECNVYFDPFLNEWRGWYIDSNTLETLFIADLQE